MRETVMYPEGVFKQQMRLQAKIKKDKMKSLFMFLCCFLHKYYIIPQKFIHDIHTEKK